MSADARRLVVGRLRKPHGLKGEVAVFPLTTDPQAVFAVGREVWLVDLAGEVVAGPVRITQSRAHHREVLVAFDGADQRSAVEPYAGLFVSVPADVLRPPEGDEVYVHELVGFAVADAAGTPLGVVTALYELASGLTLEVQGPKKEWLLPYRKAFVREVDRAARRLTVELPDGFLEL